MISIGYFVKKICSQPAQNLFWLFGQPSTQLQKKQTEIVFFLQPEAPKYLQVSIYDVEDDDGDCYRSLRWFDIDRIGYLSG